MHYRALQLYFNCVCTALYCTCFYIRLHVWGHKEVGVCNHSWRRAFFTETGLLSQTQSSLTCLILLLGLLWTSRQAASILVGSEDPDSGPHVCMKSAFYHRAIYPALFLPWTWLACDPSSSSSMEPARMCCVPLIGLTLRFRGQVKSHGE